MNPSKDTLLGGREVDVTKIDNTTETVTVRQIRIRELDTYRESEGDEVALVAFVTGKDADWVDMLMPEDFEKLLAIDAEVNGPFVRCRELWEIVRFMRQLESIRESCPDIYQEAVAALRAKIATIGVI